MSLPLDRALAEANVSIAGGKPYKDALEVMLLALGDRDANWVMQQLRESRGAWAPFADAAPGRALFIGDALSGTPVALGRLGFETTVLGRDQGRLDFAAHRARALVEAPAHFIRADPQLDQLPFGDGEFELVVQDGGLPGPATRWGHDLGECARVGSGELVLIADNRLGYKRSAGAHGVFHVLRPMEYARAAAAPDAGQRTLPGYRRALAGAGLPKSEAFALYPHSGQFVHVVSLDGELPRLPVGPKERRNRIKLLGASLGLFPVFTPSFALFGRGRGRTGPRRIERILASLAETIGEPTPVVDQLVATRGNSAVFLTKPAGATSSDPGRWCLHLPLSPSQQVLVERHHRTIQRLIDERPGVPVPAPLFAGRIEGAYVACERRLPGRSAPELSDAQPVAERMLTDAARIAAQLQLGQPAPVDADAYQSLLGFKFDLVLRYGAVESTLAKVRRFRDRARETLVGMELPRCLYHADLRGKHLQITADGRILAVLDWGTTEDPGLPYVDLLHLVIHERKQTEALSAGAAWRAVIDPATRHPHEARALESYAAALGLEPAFVRLIEDSYPVLIGAMAESNWDYSRPRWVHTQFEY